MANAERGFGEEMKDAQPRAVTEALVNLNEVHGSATTTRRVARRVDPALFLRQTIGVLFAQLQVDVFASEMRSAERILGRYAAIVFHLDVEILAGQDSLPKVQDLRKSRSIQPMIDIVGHIRLQQASVLDVVQRPAAIDKALRHVADLRDVKMGRDHIAIGQDETRRGVRVSAEK